MSTPGWRTLRVVHGFEVARLIKPGSSVVPTVPVVAGLLEPAVGNVQLAMRIGETGVPVILSLQAASQHIVNVRELQFERLRLAGETFA